MRIDKPVYCVQINREIHKYLGISINTATHTAFLRTAALSTLRPLYAGHAQVIECFSDDVSLISELSELGRLGAFVSLSKYSTFSDFLDSRRRMYEWDRAAYPMYFESDLGQAHSFPTQPHGDPSTTAILREVYRSLYLDRPPTFENKLALEERRLLQANVATLRKYVQNEEGPITGAFFRRSDAIKQDSRLDRLISRILPYQFTNIYADVFEATTPTGFPQMSFFEDNQSFPYLDFDVLSSLFTKLGLSRLILDRTTDGTRNFINFKSHKNFHEFVKAKDLLLDLLQDPTHRTGLPIERSQCVTKIRSLHLEPPHDAVEDPFVGAAAIYQACEQVCQRSSVAASRREKMPDARSWKGQYLVTTATDTEDQALREEFAARAFSKPIVVNAERLSYVEYFRSDIGRIYHVRTSAGSGGASGSFVTGKNALELLKPEYVISIGVCFGLREDRQQIGDIVISEHIHDYERLRVSDTRPEDRGATREASPVLLSRARANLAIWDGAPVHIGTVVSGEKLVDHHEFRESLKKLMPPAIAGEMEAWGWSAVCHETQRKFIMVKGICDWGENKTSDQQDVAAKNACRFAFDALIVS